MSQLADINMQSSVGTLIIYISDLWSIES